MLLSTQFSVEYLVLVLPIKAEYGEFRPMFEPMVYQSRS